MDIYNDILKEAAKAIANSSYLLISAGAGMGVDSGLPTFRGKEGFWREYPFAKKLGVSFEEMANPKWFDINPNLAWAFYGHRLELYRKSKPHIGFKILLDIANSKKDYFVLTSNVDGHFQKSGFNIDKIYEVHGSIHHLQCSEPCIEEIWSADNIKVDIDYNKFLAKDPLPKCIYCNKVARPNILMFNDFRWVEKRAIGQRERFMDFLEKLDDTLTIIEIGAGVAVPTIRLYDEEISRNYKAILIRINPQEAFDADISIPLGAKEAIIKISQYL